MHQLRLAMFGNNFASVIQYLVRDFNGPVVSRIFFRALVWFSLIRILLLWSLGHTVMRHHEITLPRSFLGKIIMAPSFLANENVDVFFGIAVVFLLVCLLLKPSYITTGLFFWFAFNLYVVYLPFGSGADYVFFMLTIWCILMATQPTFKSETGSIIQKVCHNSGIILCQLQIVFVYLVSGWDKLRSEVWRSGEAMDYVTHLGNLFNPTFSGVFDNALVQLILSWITILFELAFVVFVWFRKTKIPILLMGILFHMFIWIVLSLPDFAAIMIISYIIFLDDAELARLKDLFLKRSLP